MAVMLAIAVPADAQRKAARSVEELAGELRSSVLRSDVADLMPSASESIEIELFGGTAPLFAWPGHVAAEWLFGRFESDIGSDSKILSDAECGVC